MARILVVDDEVGIRELLSEILYDEGHTVELAENAAEARLARQRARPDLVLLDIWMPDTDGVSLLKEWSAQGLLDMPVVMMSGHATIDTAVEATRIGAFDFMEKPITLQKLLDTVVAGLKLGCAPRSAGASAAPSLPPPSSSAATATVTPEQAVPAFVEAEPAAERNEGLLGNITLDQPLRDARDEFERVYFEYHLKREGHSMTRVSEKTGLERTHLYRKLKQLGIETSRRRSNS
ncbi:response regulator [Corticimicrobacter populi]|uniref:Two-component system response regulator n=1 Tax=Corticimicrobacter populi TaxID=2175229 RepID=A0A2V1K2I5_9BURK|nr:response regulator [Corticimicrobacter populi]PWF23847.1 two-component system response regulator [Corticimicrobacter populi]